MGVGGMITQIPETDLAPFKVWLESQDYLIEPCIGEYEVLRWATVNEGNPKPIIYKRLRSNGLLTINKEAMCYYLDWKDGFV